MKYALNTGEDNRILSVTFEKYATPNMPIVDEIPSGDVTDYLYIGGEYVYDPIPAPPEPKLTVNKKMMSGEFFTIDNNIYQATTTIPAGDAVISGTNCIVINMADALNELK